MKKKISAKTVKYHISLRILHWITAVLVIGMIAGGLLMDEIPKEFKFTFFLAHFFTGIFVFLLMSARLWFRHKHGKPAYTFSMTDLELRLSDAVQSLLYLALFLQPIVGYAMVSSRQPEIIVAGIKIPMLIAKDEALNTLANEAHGIIGWTLVVLISLHILGALKHHFIDKQKIFERMV